MKKSWKTTLGGILLALGQGLEVTKPIGDWSNPAGQMLTLMGGLILGVAARDNNVTSETAGAK